MLAARSSLVVNLSGGSSYKIGASGSLPFFPFLASGADEKKIRLHNTQVAHTTGTMSECLNINHTCAVLSIHSVFGFLSSLGHIFTKTTHTPQAHNTRTQQHTGDCTNKITTLLFSWRLNSVFFQSTTQVHRPFDEITWIMNNNMAIALITLTLMGLFSLYCFQRFPRGSPLLSAKCMPNNRLSYSKKLFFSQLVLNDDATRI